MGLKKTVYFLFFCSSISLYSQIPSSSYIQNISPQTIQKNQIDTLKGYIFVFKDGEIQADSALQTVDIFDVEGRLIVNETHLEFSDIGVLTRTYLYDSINNVKELKEYESDSLVRTEQFNYDTLGNMIFWKVIFSKDKKFSFEKHMQYDSLDNLSSVKIKMGRKTVKKDSIFNEYDDMGQLLLTITYDQENKALDSTRYEYNQGDTLWSEQYYLDGQPETFKLKAIENNQQVIRTENYNEGTLLEINYRVYDKGFNLQSEKSIHTYRRMNYKKNYFYTKSGILSEKKVYHLENDPEHIVKYHFTKRAEQ